MANTTAPPPERLPAAATDPTISQRDFVGPLFKSCAFVTPRGDDALAVAAHPPPAGVNGVDPKPKAIRQFAAPT